MTLREAARGQDPIAHPGRCMHSMAMFKCKTQSSLCPRRAELAVPTQSPRRAELAAHSEPTQGRAHAEPTQSRARPHRAELAVPTQTQSSLCPRRARCAHAEFAVPTLQPMLCPHCIRPCHGAPIVRCSCAVRLLPHRAVAIVRCSRPVLLQSPWDVAIVRCR